MNAVQQHVNRRTFLALGGAVGAGAVLMAGGAGALNASGAASGTTTVTVWKLNPSWGYPLGPKGRTQVSSNASRLHAENKIFVSESAAIAGRLSPCSLAQPYSLQICAADAAELWTHSMDGGTSVDMRCAGVPEIMARAASACGTTPASQAPATPTTSAPSSSLDVESNAAQAKAPAGSLPVTGSSSLAFGAIGLGALALGALATAVASRHDDSDESLKVSTTATDTSA